MRYEDIVGMAQECGFPVAYDHFAEGESPDPPFLIFRLPGTVPFSADDIVYAEPYKLDFELYVDCSKDPGLEAQVEAVLKGHKMFYKKNEAWLGSQGLYLVLYEMGVLIDAE